MSIEIHAIQRCRLYEEPAGSLAVDHTGTLGDFHDLPLQEGGTLELLKDVLDPMTHAQHLDQWRTQIFGKKSATFNFTMLLCSRNDISDGDLTPLTRLLKIVMGGYEANDTTTFSGASSGSVFTLSTATTYEGGGVIGRLNAAGDLEAREIESKSGSTITTKYAFSSTPSTGALTYSGITCYLTQDPNTSVQMIVEGFEPQDRWLLLGGQCQSLAMNVDPTGESLPTMTFNLLFCNWLYHSEVAGSISAALALATYNDFLPMSGHDAALRLVTPGSATFSSTHVVHVSEMTFNPKIVFIPVTSPSGTNTVYRWRRSRQAPVMEGSFTTFYEDTSLFTLRDNSTRKAIWYQIGSTPGQTVLVSVPNAQIVNAQRVDAAQIAGQQMAFQSELDSDVTGTATDLRKSAFRIHFL